MSYLVDMLALLGSVQPTVHWTALYSPRLLYSCTDDLSVYSSVTQSVSEVEGLYQHNKLLSASQTRHQQIIIQQSAHTNKH